MPKKSSLLALRVSLLYGAAASLWLLLSDRILSALVTSPGALTRLQTGKGMLFVLVTGLLLYVVLRGQLRRWERELLGRRRAEADSMRLAAIVESSGDAIVSIDFNCTITSWNRGACRTFGYSAEEMVGEPASRLIPPGDMEVKKQTLERVRNGEIVQNFESVWQAKDGRLLDVSLSVSSVRDAEGKITGVSLFPRDITEQKKAAREVVRMSRLYSALSEVNEAIVHMPGREELFTRVCRVLVEYGGMRMAWIGGLDAETRRVTPLAQWGDDHGYLSQIDIVADGGELGQGPTGIAIREGKRYICNDFAHDACTGSWREAVERAGLLASASFPIRQGGIMHGVITVYAGETGFFKEEEIALLEEAAGDVSFALDLFEREEARRKADEELRENRNMLALIINSIPQAVFWKDRNSVYMGCNEVFARQQGLAAPGEIIGRTDHDFHWLKNEAAAYIADDREIMEKNRPKRRVIETMHLADGTSICAETSKVPLSDSDGHIHGLLCIFDDITERRRAEGDRMHLAAIVESADEAIISMDPDGIITSWNASAEKVFGYSQEEMAGQPFSRLIPPGLQNEKEELLERVRRGENVRGFETARLCKDGRRIDVSITISPMRDASGRITGASKLVRDITERKREAARMRLQSSALEAAANAIVITDSKGVIEWANKAFTTYTGYSLEEATGRTPALLKSGEHDGGFYQQLWETVSSGKIWHGEITNRRKDGSLYPEEMTITPLKDAQGAITHFIAVKQDITERRKLEEKFLRSQRLESVGTLASGIAHDLNNILAPILMSAELLREDLKPGERGPILTTIEECAQRGANIVNQVLTYARGVKGERIPLALKHHVREMEKMMRETFPRNITISNSVTSGLWPVSGDPTQIHQVLLNLCVNARDAMPGGGVLRISAENRDIDDAFASSILNARPGPHVMLEISDTGTGIPPEAIDKIFDPFFTTKEPGKGTGLGLSTVFGIVHSHEGFITVESKPGQGTTFNVFLPAARGADIGDEGVGDIDMPRGNGETILIVDDERSISGTISQVLKNYGYNVLATSNGVEALVQCMDDTNDIKLVLTDLMMPGMDGMALIRSLKEINPDMKIIASTGLATGNVQDELAALGVNKVLTKPYKASDLLTTLQTLIHGESQGGSRNA